MERDEFEETLKAMGVNIGNDDMDELWVSMDADGNGSVDWRVRSSFDCIINRIRVQSYVYV